MDNEEKFYVNAAMDVLKNSFAIETPTKTQIEEMKSILFHTWLRKKISLDNKEFQNAY